jgi:hypothetical protein
MSPISPFASSYQAATPVRPTPLAVCVSGSVTASASSWELVCVTCSSASPDPHACAHPAAVMSGMTP